jgi:hypothetical protein
MKIAAVMISCPQREQVRQETLARLAATDWPVGVQVILDVESMPTSEYASSNTEVRQLAASHKALQVALDQGQQWVVFMEDDLLFNRHIYANLVAWEPVANATLNLGSLYTPGGNKSVMLAGPGWYTTDASSFYGSQLLVLSREAAEYAVRHWEEAVGLQDLRISRLSAGKPIYMHDPSLVDHCGAPSTWCQYSHKAEDFSEDWHHELHIGRSV